jgi:hypothetical protein
MSLTFFYSAGAQILSNGSKLKIKESSTSNFASTGSFKGTEKV